MKKILNIILACLLVVTTVFCTVACDNGESNKKEPGFYASKIGGVFTLTQYVDDGETTVLDLSKVEDKFTEKLVRIKAGAFDGNSTIKELIVPDSVTEIDAGAFRGMTALEKITLPFVGASVNADAFSSETDGAVDKAVDAERNFGYVFASGRYEGGSLITQTFGAGSSDTATYYIPYTLKTVVIKSKSDYTIPMYAFNGLTQINTVELSNKVKGIGDKAFANSTVQTLKVGIKFDTMTKGTDWNKNANENLTIIDVDGIVER